MSFNKKIISIWLVLYTIGLIINLAIIPITISATYGWLFSGINNLLSLLLTLAMLKKVMNPLKQEKALKKNRLFYIAKLYLSVFMQVLMFFFLLLINRLALGSWSNVFFTPINGISFIVGISLPPISFIIWSGYFGRKD